MSKIIELESAINGLNDAIKNQKDSESFADFFLNKVSQHETKVFREIVVLTELSVKLNEIVERLRAIPTKPPDFSKSETKIIQSIPKLPDHSSDFDSIREEIKNLSNFISNFASNMPEISVDPPDLSELNAKLDNLLAKPMPKERIIEKTIEKPQGKKEWEFFVKRDKNGLIQSVEAIEI